MTVAQGFGGHGGLVTDGTLGFRTFRIIEEILEELRRPLDAIRIHILELLINQLQTEIMKEACTKAELRASVESYQTLLDEQRGLIWDLEQRVKNIQKARAIALQQSGPTEMS